MQHENTHYQYQGAEFCFIGIDEATHFSKESLLYIFSRNRSLAKFKPWVRMTCNPEPDTLAAEMVDWYIDEKGYPIKERGGIIRWFVVSDGEFVWANTNEELRDRYPELIPKSFTFIPATLEDNQILSSADPGYKANLLMQKQVEQERLLRGNWRIRASTDCLFENDSILYSLRGNWQNYQPDRRYIAAIDPNFGGSDYFTTHIYDISDRKMELVAEYHEQNRNVTYSIAQSKILFEIYRPVKIVVETNTGGKIVAENLADYPIAEVTTNKLNKVINTDRIAILLLRGLIVFPSGWAGASEFRNFSVKERRAIAGHDDRVMCCAIAGTIFDEVCDRGSGMGFGTG